MICDNTSATVPLPHPKKDGKKNDNKKKRLGCTRLFPTKIYELLGEVDELGFSDAFSWLTHGRAFLIKDEDVFLTKVMPRRFKASKIQSFHRQLYKWGFHRIPNGRDEGAWWHPSFLRDHPEKIQKIVRKQSKGEAYSTPDVPNFYDNMPPTLQTGGANQPFKPDCLRAATGDVVVPTLSTNEGGGICVDEEIESWQSCHDIPRHACSLPKKEYYASSPRQYRFHTVETSPAKTSMKLGTVMRLCHQPIDVITASFMPPMENIRAKPDFAPWIIHQGGHSASTEVGDTDDLDEFSEFIDNNILHLPFDGNMHY